MHDSIIKKFVRTLMPPIVIGTPYIMPKNYLVVLLADTIYAKLISFSNEVIRSIARSAVSFFIVFSSAPELISLRKVVPLILMGTLGQSLRRCSMPAGRS